MAQVKIKTQIPSSFSVDHLPRWVRALRIGPLEILIKPSNGWFKQDGIRLLGRDGDLAWTHGCIAAHGISFADAVRRRDNC
jgi:hypothetical protein